jgi:short-subunit dehydrogenase
MRTNFLSPVALSLAVLPRMLERDAGVILNMSSLAGRLGVANEAAYAASKFALSGWSEAMALDLWSTGVDVRLVLPGAIATEIWDQPGNDRPAYDGPFEPAESVAEGICDALVSDGFERYVPDLKEIVAFKTTDIDEFMTGAAAFIAERTGEG